MEMTGWLLYNQAVVSILKPCDQVLIEENFL